MTLSLTCKLMLGSLITMMMTAHAAEHVSTTISLSIHPITHSYRSSAEVWAASSDAEWYELKQDNLIYITLNNGRLVVMELNDTFAPQHADQIRRLAKAGIGMVCLYIGCRIIMLCNLARLIMRPIHS